ncbi:MAG: hypothetical protein IJS14_04340 [Lentisphaeria bacterium]|nr:hypothetical protein [Lentisphaeria bacterium]
MDFRKFIIGSLLAAASAGACGAENFTVKALPAEDSEIELDGVPDEPVWRKAEKHGGFTVFRHPEKPAPEPTSFQAAASRSGLYFAFDVTDRDMVATVTEFDGPVASEDSIELFITADDPIPNDPNVHNCRQLLFSPAGVRADLTYLAGTGSRKWTSDWRVAVKRNDKGFTAELFLPYYALNIDNVRCRRFHFNIARENITDGKRRITVWSPTSRFIDQNRFGTLELPFDDFSAYQWRLDQLELKNIPAAAGAVQTLSGRISGKKAGEITLQAAARRDGKIVAFNRCTVKADGNDGTAFRMPLKVGTAGQYQVTVTGRTQDGKVLHHLCDLVMEALPFKLRLDDPVYRKSIFPDQEDKTLRVSIDYQTGDAKLLDGVKTIFTVTDPSGKVIASNALDSGPVRTFTADASNWAPGKYSITVKSAGSEALTGTLQETVEVIAPPAAGNTVRLGKAREIYLNGKRFFPRGFLGGDNRKAEFFKELSEAGYNAIHFYTINQMKPETIRFVLDKAQKHNLKVFCYPYYRCKVSTTGFRPVYLKKGSPRLPEQAWKEMREWVAKIKDHPAFLGWYLCDEPKGVEFYAELRRVYQMLKEVDPHHPVISLDMTADGCISKREGYADLHILDMYPHPLTNGGWQRSISSVLYSMKLVSDGVAPQGAWFCPEAFKPRRAENRSLTYREIRCIVFGAIVNGATGIVPFKIGDPPAKYYRNANSGIFESPDMHLGYLKGIGPELRGMDPVLLEPERLEVRTGNGHIIAMRKKHEGKEFIFAVNTMPDSIDCTLTGPGLADGKYRVLGENRTVEVRNGRLEDSFVGYMTHFYTNDAGYPAPVDIAALEAEIAEADANARKAAPSPSENPAKSKKKK